MPKKLDEKIAELSDAALCERLERNKSLPNSATVKELLRRFNDRELHIGELTKRRDDLLAANSRYLERARDAEYAKVNTEQELRSALDALGEYATDNHKLRRELEANKPRYKRVNFWLKWPWWG